MVTARRMLVDGQCSAGSEFADRPKATAEDDPFETSSAASTLNDSAKYSSGIHADREAAIIGSSKAREWHRNGSGSGNINGETAPRIGSAVSP